MFEVYLQYVNIKYDNSDEFGFFITYIGEHWAFINEIRLLVDGKVHVYSPSQEPQREVGGLLGVIESIQFKIPEEVFNKIQTCDKFDLRINGQRRSFDVNSNDDLINKMKIWYSTIKNK